jgi:hypothetical protein
MRTIPNGKEVILMNYEKPTMNTIGNAQALVLGTKHLPPLPDNVPPDFRKSIAAYESDE